MYLFLWFVLSLLAFAVSSFFILFSFLSFLFFSFLNENLMRYIYLGLNIKSIKY